MEKIDSAGDREKYVFVNNIYVKSPSIYRIYLSQTYVWPKNTNLVINKQSSIIQGFTHPYFAISILNKLRLMPNHVAINA